MEGIIDEEETPERSFCGAGRSWPTINPHWHVIFGQGEFMI